VSANAAAPKAAPPSARRTRPTKAPTPWPATQIEIFPIKLLVPYAKNARVHSQSQVLGIARSMLEFGWTNPVLRDEHNTIIAGHGRILGAAVNVDRGHSRFANAPVMTARGWTDAQKKAYAIADNQLALNAGWDAKLLESELKEISAMGFSMELLGFSAQDLIRHLGANAGGLTDPNAVPAAPARPVSKPGDLWLCGPHRILCGDATSREDVARLTGNTRMALMCTDPPYGVAYDPEWRHARGLNASNRVGSVNNDDRVDWRAAWSLFTGPVAYVWHGGKFAAPVQDSLEAAGFEMRSQIIWRKSHLVISRGDYHWQHEPCWYAVRKSTRANWRGGRKQSTIWDIAGIIASKETIDSKEADDASIHGTQKPVECMRRPIENNTDEGDVVYDPFVGSGTTVIAAQQIARACYAVELNPVYVDVAVRRWQNFTGLSAKLSGRDLSFDEMDSERNHGRARTKTNANKPARSAGQRRPPAAERARAKAPAGQTEPA
jgi:DNA modification methylase